MQDKGMRIGLTGPASSGKTTLANWLGASYGIPVVKEGVREYCAERGLDLETARSNVIAFQEAILTYRQEQMNAVIKEFDRGFVSDRTPIDNLIYLAQYYPKDAGAAPLRQYYTRCMDELRENFDVLVIVPEFAQNNIVQDGFRTVNYGAHFMWNYALHGLLLKTILTEDGMPDVFFIQSMELEARKKEITELLKLKEQSPDN